MAGAPVASAVVVVEEEEEGRGAVGAAAEVEWVGTARRESLWDLRGALAPALLPVAVE